MICEARCYLASQPSSSWSTPMGSFALSLIAKWGILEIKNKQLFGKRDTSVQKNWTMHINCRKTWVLRCWHLIKNIVSEFASSFPKWKVVKLCKHQWTSWYRTGISNHFKVWHSYLLSSPRINIFNIQKLM